MEELIKLKHKLSAKKSEEDFFKNELNRVKTEVVKIERDLENECKKYITDYSDNIISCHPHYEEKHAIEKKQESYYDNDWYRDTYGVRNPVDSFGLRPEYKGPNTILYTFCKDCDVYFNKKYRYPDEEVNGDEIFKNGILIIEQKKLEKILRGY